MRRRLFKYSLRRTLLWVAFYGAIAAVVVLAVALTNHYLHERTNDIDGQVNISLSKLKYEVGEEIQFSVVNDSGSTVIIDNDCPQEPLMVYFWKDSKWTRIHKYISEDVCPNQDRQISVKPRKSLTGSYKYWRELFNEPGIYRIAVVANGYSGLAFQDIEVVNNQVVVPVEQPVLEQKSIRINNREDDRFEEEYDD